jgi:4-amino-4-deoxy-L-arabinose transferase-like glycosyltransferase
VAEEINNSQRTADVQVSGVARSWTLRKWHVWILVVGLLLRIGFCLMTSSSSALAEVDGREHHAYAQSLLALKWDDYPRYFNCIRPPLYPIFLTPFVALSARYVWHIQLAQAMLGVLQALIVGSIAGRWAGQRAGNWAFLIVLFHPFLIFFNAFLLTETLFITLLWAGIACLQQYADRKTLRWLAASAVTLALACLTRPSLQPFLVVAVIWIGRQTWYQRSRLVALKRMAYFTTLVSVMLLPWMIGNLRAHGDFSLSPYCGARTYALGNSAEYLSLYQARTKDEYYQRLNHINELLSVKGGKSAEQWMTEVRAFKQDRGGAWWSLQWHKLKHFWTPWLNPLIFPRTTFLLSVFSATPIFLLGGVELLRRLYARDQFSFLLLGLIATGYLVGGVLFQVQVRYRIPFVDVGFIVLSASLLGRISLSRLTALRLFRRFRLAGAV